MRALRNRGTMPLVDRLLLMGRDKDNSAPWTPLSLPNLVCWADAATIAGFDGDPVSLWNDSSGGGNSFTQATTSRRPVLRTAQIGSESVVEFDGADDFLATAAPVIEAPGDFALWTVAYQYAQTGDARATLSTGYNSGFGVSANGVDGLGGIFGGIAWIGNGVDGTGRWLFYVTRRMSGALSLVVNGVSIVSGDTHVPATEATGTLFGCGDPSVPAYCRIAQAGFINGALSDADRTQLAAYIAGRYGTMDGSGL